MDEVVVFDLDDTLYKEIDYLGSAFSEIASWIESAFDKKDVRRFMLECHGRGKDVFESINRHYQLDIPKQTYLCKYRNHVPNINLSEGMEELLATLSARGCAIGLITDGREISQRNKIKALGLERYMDKDHCIVSESFGHAKPSEKAYLYFQERYPHARYCYVGDNVKKDFSAPNRLGWTTICLKDNGKNIHRQLIVNSELSAKYIAENVDDLKTMLGI